LIYSHHYNVYVRPIVPEWQRERVVKHRDVPGDWIEPREKVPGHRGGDDRYPRPPHIPQAEIAPGQERDAEGLEIPRRHKGDRRPLALFRRFHMALRDQIAASRPATLD